MWVTLYLSAFKLLEGSRLELAETTFGRCLWNGTKRIHCF